MVMPPFFVMFCYFISKIKYIILYSKMQTLVQENLFDCNSSALLVNRTPMRGTESFHTGGNNVPVN